MSHSIFMVLNPIFCYVSHKIVIFHEPLIVETCNKCHWIWHALNPKYTIVIFHEPLIVETCNMCHWIWHATNPKYAPLKLFDAFFPVKINKM